MKTEKEPGTPIVYHKDHLPANLTGEYSYTYHWSEVTDPAALKKRQKELLGAGKETEANEIAQKLKNASEAETEVK